MRKIAAGLALAMQISMAHASDDQFIIHVSVLKGDQVIMDAKQPGLLNSEQTFFVKTDHPYLKSIAISSEKPGTYELEPGKVTVGHEIKINPISIMKDGSVLTRYEFESSALNHMKKIELPESSGHFIDLPETSSRVITENQQIRIGVPYKVVLTAPIKGNYSEEDVSLIIEIKKHEPLSITI